MNEAEELKQKYKREIEERLSVSSEDLLPIRTREFVQFSEELKPREVIFYERMCNSFEKVIKFSPSPKAREKILDAINTAHLGITPEGVYTFSYLFPLLLLFISLLLLGVLPYIVSGSPSLFFLGLSMLVSLVLIIPLQKYPSYTATAWRLKSANQMVLCIFYIVTYMRQSSNIERAIEFASNHLDPPLSLDLRKILWNVENGKYDTINDALDEYLKSWKKYSDEFIDAIHLIQSSLLEGDEGRRLALLDKSLDVILEGTYEKMLHYAQNLKNPITTLHMLGVILPVMGLVILPLAVSFLEGMSWYHLAVFYNLILPVVVFFLSKSILSSRPSGYGDADISETVKGLRKYAGFSFFGFRFSPLFCAIFLFSLFIFLGIFPVLSFWLGVDDVCWSFDNGITFCSDVSEKSCKMIYCAWKYVLVQDKFSEPIVDPRSPDVVAKMNQGMVVVGPFGFLASLLSVFVPVAFGLALGYYFRLNSKSVIKVREETKKMEKEFSTALFQLGNRLGDGLPVEIAIPKVAEIMSGTVSGSFFSQVNSNMQKLGMGIVPAIFDRRQGAINYFPSKIIESSMKVLVESVKKGPLVAAQAVNNIARYIKEIHRVNERLKDLLSDIISSMKQQISFLAPVISGVVVGITSLITYIFGRLKSMMIGFQSDDVSGFADMFGVGVPTYYFQIVVGVYVVEIVYILSVMANSIENGQDGLGERDLLGRNLVRSTILYSVITFLVMIVFQVMAGEIINRSGVI
jgi:hypothetical protein